MSTNKEISPHTPKIDFVRHGQTYENISKTLGGNREAMLTPEGKLQAKKIGKHIVDSGISYDLIISSPKYRAINTALLIANQWPAGSGGTEIVVVPELHERSGGNYEGGKLKDFYKATDDEIADAGGESYAVLANRVKESQEKVFELAKNRERTLVVGHAEWYRMAKALEIGLAAHHMDELAKPGNGRLLNFPLIPASNHESESSLVIATVAETIRAHASNNPNSYGPLFTIPNRNGEPTELVAAPWSGYRETADIHLGASAWEQPNIPTGRPKRLKMGSKALVSIDRSGNPDRHTWVTL